MTTSEKEAGPAERTAGNTATAPGSELASQDAPRGGAQETAPLTGSIATAPDDARQLEREIERTREQLGETVQELLAKVDVKARARAKATELSGKFKDTMVQARGEATNRAGRLRSQVSQAGTNGASGARQHGMALAIALGVVSVGCLAVRQWLIRTSSATR